MMGSLRKTALSRGILNVNRLSVVRGHGRLLFVKKLRISGGITHVLYRPFTLISEFQEKLIRLPVERNGVSFQLGVVDVGRVDDPVVLCSHGVPGGAEDFFTLLPNLLEMNLRVIIPTYPGFGFSPVPERDLFQLDHSTVEKVELLKLICKERQVKCVTLMLSHSQGSTAAYKFCAEEDVKSAIFLAPCGKTPQKNVQPFWLFLLFVGLLKNPLFRPLMSKLLLKFYEKLGFKERNIGRLQASVLTVSSVDFPKSLGYLQTIIKKKIPAVFAMSKKDRIVEWETPFSLLQEVGFPLDNTIYYDKDFLPSHFPNTDLDKDWFARAAVFSTGGHNFHKKHSSVICNYIKELIDYVQLRKT